MTIYWLLFAFAAIMALSYPTDALRGSHGQGQKLAFAAFLLFYFLIATLRYETGGDWLTYGEMFEDIRPDTLAYAMTRTDPLFGALMWVSAQLGTGIFLVNGIASWLLGLGTIRVARMTREPWLAILVAVPYLLIVVGMGYVRQGAAIGVVLIAIASLGRARPMQTIAYLALATGLHSTAALTIPLFGYALTRRYRGASVLVFALGALAYVYVIAPRLNTFEVGYIDAEYDSGGAMVRILMSFLPSALLIVRRRAFFAGEPIRSIWMAVAISNFIAMAALAVSPSSTAVDRIGLYFSVIQIVVFGEIRDLTGMSKRGVLLLRLLCIAVVAAVQTVWLVFGTHAEFWVPYRWVIELL